MVGERRGDREKRTRMRGAERRELILHCTKGVFARQSYAEASTSELAQASGISEPMLYKHFGSKKRLFLAVVERFSEHFLALWRSMVERRAERDLLEALSFVLMDYRTALKADPEIHRVLFQAIAESGDAEIARGVRKHNRSVYTYIHLLLERARAGGWLAKEIDLDAACWGYVSFVFAMQHSLMLSANAELSDHLLAEASRLWLQTLRIT